MLISQSQQCACQLSVSSLAEENVARFCFYFYEQFQMHWCTADVLVLVTWMELIAFHVNRFHFSPLPCMLTILCPYRIHWRPREWNCVVLCCSIKAKSWLLHCTNATPWLWDAALLPKATTSPSRKGIVDFPSPSLCIPLDSQKLHWLLPITPGCDKLQYQLGQNGVTVERISQLGILWKGQPQKNGVWPWGSYSPAEAW